MMIKFHFSIFSIAALFLNIYAINNGERVKNFLKRSDNGKGKAIVEQNEGASLSQSPQHKSEPQYMRQYPEHRSKRIRSDFFHSLYGLRGDEVKGVYQVKVNGDPKGIHENPFVTFHKGKKGGTVVAAVVGKPLPYEFSMERKKLKDLEETKRRKTGHQAQMCVRIGECYSKDHQTGQHSESHVGFLSTKEPGVTKDFIHNLNKITDRGYEFRGSTSRTVLGDKKSSRNLPFVDIQPGKETAHIVGVFSRPHSPPSKSKFKLGRPSTSNSEGNQKSPNLIDELIESSKHQIHIKEKERSTGIARKKEPVGFKQNVKLGLD